MPIENPVPVQIASTNSGSFTGGAYTPLRTPVSYMATEAGTGAVTGTVLIEVTNTPSVTTSWITLGTITLSGTTTAQDGFSSAARWACVRARTTAITGTGAIITVTMVY